MTLEEIIAAVGSQKEDLSTSDITKWANMCLGELSSICPVESIQTITKANDKNTYNLPVDYVETAYLMDADARLDRLELSDNASAGYKLWGSSLILQPTPKDTGSITHYYYATIPKLVGSTDVPAIPAQFHDVIVLYTVAKAQYQDEEEGLKSDAFSDYLRRKQELAAYMSLRAGSRTIEDVYGI